MPFVKSESSNCEFCSCSQEANLFSSCFIGSKPVLSVDYIKTNLEFYMFIQILLYILLFDNLNKGNNPGSGVLQQQYIR